MDGVPEGLTRDEIARQVRQQLESLKAAGVEWLPRSDGPPFQIPEEAEMGRARMPVATAGSLFAGAEPEAGMGPESRLIELKQVEETVAGCLRCPELASTRTQTVFGVGPLDAELCFI